MDFEVQRCSRRCSKTGRPLQPGEIYCSALVVEGATVARYDFAEEAWEGPPEGALGWWKSRIPVAEVRRPVWAPNDVMLDLFEQWEHEPDKADMRYVLALLLLRRRVLRLEEEMPSEADAAEAMQVYCPRREATYTVHCVLPSEERMDWIQQELARLLVAGSE